MSMAISQGLVDELCQSPHLAKNRFSVRGCPCTVVLSYEKCILPLIKKEHFLYLPCQMRLKNCLNIV